MSHNQKPINNPPYHSFVIPHQKRTLQGIEMQLTVNPGASTLLVVSQSILSGILAAHYGKHDAIDYDAIGYCVDCAERLIEEVNQREAQREQSNGGN